jgi:hypothetical protein
MKKFTVVAMDETRDWSRAALIKQAGGTLYTLYAFEEGKVEPGGSTYYLVPFDVVPSARPKDASKWEFMYDELQAGLNFGCGPTYFPCSQIDGLADQYKHTEEFDETETLDDALEHFRGNCTVPEVCR